MAERVVVNLGHGQRISFVSADDPQPQRHGPLLCWCREFGRTCPPQPESEP